jgi:hypothetical protein
MINGDDLIHSFNHTESTEGNFRGLTKREYFAAMAMIGMLANTKMWNSESAANDSVQQADALITALNQQP